MQPEFYEFNEGDYFNAVKGAKAAVEFLKNNHASPEKCQIQLWENDPHGVILDYQGSLTDEVPKRNWEPSFHTIIENEETIVQH